MAVDDLSDGIRKRGDLANAGRHRRNTALVEREPIDQRCAEVTRAAGVKVTLVGLDDLAGAVLEGCGDGLESSVLDA
jgi:hypothetical protein